MAVLGELQDAGNTVTLARYLGLPASAGLIVGMRRFAGARLRQRGSSPKLLVRNTVLMSAFLVGADGIPLADFLSEPVESWL